MTAIVFGINGQDGFYLSKILIDAGVQVIGVSRTNSEHILGDVGNYALVEQLIKQHQPQYIFHLAANSTTRHDTLFENYQTITTGTLNICEAAHRHSRHSKIFISGSALQFKNTGAPISEADVFEARDSYSMARIQSVYTARYFLSLGLQVYVGYFFNHDSPLRSDRHVNKKIITAAQRIAKGDEQKLHLGDITIQKEFTYAGDTAQAIWQLINNDTVYETVIGSGEAYPLSYWLAYCFDYYKLNWQDHVVIDPNFKSDYQVLVSDPSTLFKLGWQPQVDIDQLAQMMLTQ